MNLDGLLRGVHLFAALPPDHAPGWAAWPRAGTAPERCAIGWRAGRIAWLGPEGDLPAGVSAEREWTRPGCWLTPGLIDCHTHLVYAGHRAAEWSQRLEGASYEEIARSGGGILSTVRATRAASVDDLVAQSAPRLAALRADGVTTVEIKSGYGLSLPAEAAQLRAARRLGEQQRVTVRTTFLGAHALPPEFAGRGDEYIDHLIADMLPALQAERLVDAVDAFCETIGFSPAQVTRLFAAARAAGLPMKLHAEQLSNQQGAALVARHGGLSADHLEWLDEAGIAAMQGAGTVAVLLPAAFYVLREQRLPPIAALRAAGVPMAVATDCNPGTAPMASLRLAMNMACTLFRLTPHEALLGATRHAAAALGLADRGQLAIGQRADLALWAINHPAELAYHMGQPQLRTRFFEGQPDV